MSQKQKHIMELIPIFRKIIESLEIIKKEVVSKSGIDYKSQDARMVALDSIQMSRSKERPLAQAAIRSESRSFIWHPKVWMKKLRII